jgi:hypothetical protein
LHLVFLLPMVASSKISQKASWGCVLSQVQENKKRLWNNFLSSSGPKTNETMVNPSRQICGDLERQKEIMFLCVFKLSCTTEWWKFKFYSLFWLIWSLKMSFLVTVHWLYNKDRVIKWLHFYVTVKVVAIGSLYSKM